MTPTYSGKYYRSEDPLWNPLNYPNPTARFNTFQGLRNLKSDRVDKTEGILNTTHHKLKDYKVVIDGIDFHPVDNTINLNEYEYLAVEDHFLVYCMGSKPNILAEGEDLNEMDLTLGVMGIINDARDYMSNKFPQEQPIEGLLWDIKYKTPYAIQQSKQKNLDKFNNSNFYDQKKMQFIKDFYCIKNKYMFGHEEEVRIILYFQNPIPQGILYVDIPLSPQTLNAIRPYDPS